MEEYSERGFVERRRYPRLKTIGGNAMVFLPDEALVGELVDISLGGLAFYYSDTPSRQEYQLQSGILVGDDDLWLEDFPIKTVHDFVVEIPVFSKRPILRRRCLAFGPLSNHQKSLLEQYIWLNTHEESYSLFARPSGEKVSQAAESSPAASSSSAPPLWRRSDR